MGASETAEIEALAWRLWEQRGCPAGPSHLDWLEAERQLQARPVAPAVADVVPANAEEKWLADIERKQEFESQS